MPDSLVCARTVNCDYMREFGDVGSVAEALHPNTSKLLVFLLDHGTDEIDEDAVAIEGAICHALHKYNTRVARILLPK